MSMAPLVVCGGPCYARSDRDAACALTRVTGEEGRGRSQRDGLRRVMSAGRQQGRHRHSASKPGDLYWATLYVVVVAALALGSTQVGRYPVTVGMLAGALFVPNVALGFLVGRLRWCALAAVVIVLLPLAASLDSGPIESGPAAFFALITGGAVAVAGSILIAVGVGLSSSIARWRPAWRGASRALLAGLLLGAAPVCLIVPVIERNRTIRLSPRHPVAIDLARGRYRGVGLDSDRPTIEAVLGRGVPRQNSNGEPLDAGTSPYSGPNSLPGYVGDQTERYRGASLHLARSGRVDYVEITDRHARTAAGIGPGDSLSVAAKAYPALRCGEFPRGAEEPPTPYPSCSARLGPRRYVYLGSTYTEPGVAVTNIWLSTTPIS